MRREDDDWIVVVDGSDSTESRGLYRRDDKSFWHSRDGTHHLVDDGAWYLVRGGWDAERKWFAAEDGDARARNEFDATYLRRSMAAGTRCGETGWRGPPTTKWMAHSPGHQQHPRKYDEQTTPPRFRVRMFHRGRQRRRKVLLLALVRQRVMAAIPSEQRGGGVRERHLWPQQRRQQAAAVRAMGATVLRGAWAKPFQVREGG